MANALELHDARVSEISFRGGVATIRFSFAHIHQSKGSSGRGRGVEWSQAAQLILCDVQTALPLPPLPNTVAEGFLEVGGIRHEVLRLPFKRKVGARLYLAFVDGAEIMLTGTRPVVELIGPPIY